MRVLVVVVAALALAATATAGVTLPAGSTEAKVLEPAASYATGFPVVVACVPRSTLNVGEGGYALITDRTMVLDASLCRTLTLRLHGKLVDGFDVAEALLSLAHEAVHLTGVIDESQTECAAIPKVPAIASRFFGYRTWRSRHDLMTDVWNSHNGLSAAYTRDC